MGRNTADEMGNGRLITKRVTYLPLNVEKISTIGKLKLITHNHL